MQFIKRHIYIVSTFAIAFVVMLIGFAVTGKYPVGENQIMVIDSWHQYYPFLQELHYKLQHGESIFYSWNMGMGSNFFLVMAYYAFSPIYLLSVIFPKEYLREFMLLATAIKIAFAGAFFSIYLKNIFKKEDYTITGFGLLYAFCGFAMGYYWNIMWLDAMALLPLIILGLNRLIDGEGVVLYIVTLALAMISNFYIGFFICEFILFYFFILYFTKTEGFSFEKLVKKTFEVALYSILAVGVAAIVLLPTFRGLQLSYAVNSTFPATFKTYFSMLEILNNMLIGSEPTVKAGLPNVYSSFIAIYLMGFFYVSTNVSIKEKVFSFMLITFFMLSFNINYLNYIWHGFHFPNEVPYRFSFIFSFLIIGWAYQGLQNKDSIPRRNIWFIGIALMGYLIVNETLELKDVVFYTSMGALALYSVLFLSYRYEKIRPRFFAIGLSILLIGEVLISGITGTATTGGSGRASYPYLGDEVKSAVQSLYATDDSAYRMDMVKWYSTNDPALYGYKGVSMFSSTANADVTRYTKSLGLAASPESNRYLYTSTTPLVNGLLGVKYLIGRDHAGTEQNAGYSLLSKSANVSIYENKYTLPLGFMVDYGVYNWNNTFRSPFDVQEDFVTNATGVKTKLFTDVPITGENFVNMERKSFENIRYGYRNLDSGKVGNATLYFHAPETKQMYMFMFANRSYKTKVTVNEETIEYETRRGLVVDLGVLEQGTEIKLEFEVQAASEGYYNLQMVTFDEAAYSEVYKKLADEPFQIDTFKSTKIEGRITANTDGVLYTSIPYEKGWKVKVDGEEVYVDPIHNAMLAVQLTQGTHEIKMTYIPNGFLQGLLISLVSIVITVGIYLKIERPNNRKRILQTEKNKKTESDKTKELNAAKAAKLADPTSIDQAIEIASESVNETVKE